MWGLVTEATEDERRSEAATADLRGGRVRALRERGDFFKKGQVEAVVREKEKWFRGLERWEEEGGDLLTRDKSERATEAMDGGWVAADEEGGGIAVWFWTEGFYPLYLGSHALSAKRVALEVIYLFYCSIYFCKRIRRGGVNLSKKQIIIIIIIKKSCKSLLLPPSSPWQWQSQTSNSNASSSFAFLCPPSKTSLPHHLPGFL